MGAICELGHPAAYRCCPKNPFMVKNKTNPTFRQAVKLKRNPIKSLTLFYCIFTLRKGIPIREMTTETLK